METTYGRGFFVAGIPDGGVGAISPALVEMACCFGPCLLVPMWVTVAGILLQVMRTFREMVI